MGRKSNPGREKNMKENPVAGENKVHLKTTGGNEPETVHRELEW